MDGMRKFTLLKVIKHASRDDTRLQIVARLWRFCGKSSSETVLDPVYTQSTPSL